MNPQPVPASPSPVPEATDALFHAYKFRNSNERVAAYFIESTASANVDVADPPDNDLDSLRILESTERLSDAGAVDEIAAQVKGMKNPEMVFLIHGFNNPRPVVLKRLEQAFESVAGDPAMGGGQGGHGLICMGYRWPSERIGGTLASTLSAAPGILYLLLGVMVAAGLVGLAGRFNLGGLAAIWVEWGVLTLAALWLLWQNAQSGVGRRLLALLALLGALGLLAQRDLLPAFLAFRWSVPVLWLTLVLITFVLPMAAFLLRILVYFRDAYRAVNYGVPDLVNVIRQIDAALGARPENDRVRLSFIGHSMGAFVTTSLVRVLADAFAPDALPANSQRANENVKAVSSNIGQALCFGRLVLVSPDIPAETLMTRRANFLRSSLRRFEEAYLFSNEGDEVLRLVSTLANYFSFPNRSRDFGFRLGNAEVRGDGPDDKGYGIVNLDRLRQPRPLEQVVSFLDRLRVGPNTLLSLLNVVRAPGRDTKQNADRARRRAETDLPPEPPVASVDDLPFPVQFTYFDCTDYVDVNPAKGGRAATVPSGILTYAKKKARLSVANHWSLLLQYFFAAGTRKVDVHSGYFDGPFVQRLIFRLCCLGWEGTLAATHAEAAAALALPGASPDREAALDALSLACRAHQIQALLSPARYLGERPGASSKE